jgi:hypothetical protein
MDDSMCATVSVLIFCVSIGRDTYVKEMSGETKNDRNDRGLLFLLALNLLLIISSLVHLDSFIFEYRYNPFVSCNFNEW